MTEIIPLPEVLLSRGFHACACGAAHKRTAPPWACESPRCRSEIKERGEVAFNAARSADGAGINRDACHAPIPKRRPGQASEDALALLLDGAGFPVLTFPQWLAKRVANPWPTADLCVREFPVGLLLDPPRQYRADFFLPSRRLAIECKGRAHVAGAARLKRDNEREGLLVAAGLRVLPIDPDQVTKDEGMEALRLVKAALKGGG